MSQANAVLTIGIPTYNRRDAIAGRVEELLELDLGTAVEVLVVDNHSSDGTFEYLVSRFAETPVRILTNAENLGFAGNVLRLIDEVRTDYLVIVSDEDHVIQEGLEVLIEFCRSRRPRLVSPRARSVVSDDYRGRHETREIAPEEFNAASFYISGLTFESVSAKSYLDKMRALIPSNSAATVYPQVLLTALAVSDGDCYFLDAVVTAQVDTLPSHIADSSGIKYASVAGRMAQFVGYEQFFAGELSSQVNAASAERLNRMREHERREFTWLLAQAAASEVPALEPYLWRSFVRIAWAGAKGRLMKPVASVVRWLKSPLSKLRARSN